LKTFLSPILKQSAQMPETAILVKGLSKQFDDFVAVDEVSFEVFPKEVVGYLGPNGSGKTTTIRVLLGLLLPSAGTARVLGWDVVRQPEKVRREVGYMSQKFALYDELTAWENLAFYAGVYGVNEPAHLHTTLDRVGLRGLDLQRAGQLPTGFRQRLALATAIVHRPRLLFLDEPTSGVDPNARRAFWDLIYDLATEGMTIFATTHYMDEAEYCQRVGVMRAGRLLAFDSPTNLKRDALGGRAWDVRSADLLAAVDNLAGITGVKQVNLSSDHLRLVTDLDVSREELEAVFQNLGMGDARIDEAEPSLEDVFLALAGK
jgi:ABC-2 type transport system ATP-binding protein